MKIPEKIEPIFKWVCLLLIVVLLFIAAYSWRDAKHDLFKAQYIASYEQLQTQIQAQIQRTDNLAAALGDFNKIVSGSLELSTSVNKILQANGYPQHMKPIEAAPDTSGGE